MIFFFSYQPSPEYNKFDNHFTIHGDYSNFHNTPMKKIFLKGFYFLFFLFSLLLSNKKSIIHITHISACYKN